MKMARKVKKQGKSELKGELVNWKIHIRLRKQYREKREMETKKYLNVPRPHSQTSSQSGKE